MSSLSPTDNDAAMRHGTFIALILAITLGVYAALLGIGASPLYCTYSRSFADAAICYQPEVKDQRADILLVGDSSLLYGVRPLLVAGAGGGSTYNLGTVGPSFGFGPEMMIDRYLAQNGRPKAIILYFSPAHLISKERIIDPRWSPLGLFLLQHGGPSEIARFVRTMPSALVELPPLIVNSLSLRAGPVPGVGAQMAADGGHLDYPHWINRVLPEACKPSHAIDGQSLPDNRLALAALRARYAAQGLPIFVYIAPTAACDGMIGAIQARYRGVADNSLEAGPNQLFADDADPHVHASAAGVEVFSRRLATFIQTVVRPAIAAR